MPSIESQLAWLLILAIPVACVTRTVIYEEIFREPREFCKRRSENCRRLLQRKLFYLFTCEYCFSHWVTIAFLLLTGFRLLLPDWRGSVLAFFSVVLVANVYLNLYARLRLELTVTRAETRVKERTAEKLERNVDETPDPAG